jgi:hypothetical protein
MGEANAKLDGAYGESWVKGTPNAKNCSGFMKSLGRKLGIYLVDDVADKMIEKIDRDPAWEPLGTGKLAMIAATHHAQAKRLVIAAVTSKEYKGSEGHVAVLLPKAAKNGEPLVYCGSTGAAQSPGTKSIFQVFSRKKLNMLRFYLYRSTLLGTYD